MGSELVSYSMQISTILQDLNDFNFHSELDLICFRSIDSALI